MSYPGNPTLEPEIQDRITTTFEQTVELAGQRKDQEARLGCEFILRMDPQFRPARELLARLKGGSATSGAGVIAAGSSRVERNTTGRVELAELDDLNLDDLDDLEELGELDDLVPTPAAPPRPTAPSGLGAVVSDLMAQRKYAQVLQIAQTQRETVARDPQLQGLIAQAQERVESEPFVSSFLAEARAAFAEGRTEDAERALTKARQLDPDHPSIAELEVSNKPKPSGHDLGDFAALQQASLSLRIEGEDEEEDSFSGLLSDDESFSFDDTSATKEIGEPDDTELLSFDDTAEPGPFDDTAEPGPFDHTAEPGPFDDTAEPGPFDHTAEPGSFDAESDLAPLDDELLTFDDPADDGPAPTTGFDLDQDVESPPPIPPSEVRSGKIGGADDSGDRVQQLLEEGQIAFERGQYQAAIDVWSRIFLIEIDNSEASRRIEAARNQKAELERQAEEVLHQAVEEIRGNDLDAAAQSLRRVLELAPQHSTARDYLEQIEAGKVPTVRKRDVVSDVDALDDDDLQAGTEVADGGKSMEAAVARDRLVAVKKTNKGMVAAGAALLAALLIGGIWVATHWGDLFPNAEPVASAPQRIDPISRATEMHESGNTENALLLLRRIAPEDPSYPQAQNLIAEWERLVATADPTPTGPDEGAIARRRQLIDAAAAARTAGQHRRAVELLASAGRITPLGSDEAAWKRQSEEALEPLRAQLVLFAEGSYKEAIPELWRLHEKDPGNRDIVDLLVDSYYNLALRELQRGNVTSAASMAEEALGVQPDNTELQRIRLFAKAYEDRSQDLLYRIFVKYLPARD